MMTEWDPRTLRCVCHGQDLCPDFEAYCDAQQAQWEWDNMSQADKDKIHEWNAAWCLVGPFGAFHGILRPEVDF